jgi:hypothetical protein
MEQTKFTDSDGVSWIVGEDGADEARELAVAGTPGTTWLRFESELEVRRLWHYPDDWRGLSPLQLESLLDRASTVIARFRPVPRRSAVADGALGPEDQSLESRATPQRADRPLADP